MTPNQMQDLAVSVLRIYQDAETKSFQAVAKRIARGIDEEGWAEQKASEIRSLRREVQQIIQTLEEFTSEELEALLAGADEAGQQEALNDLAKDLGKEVVKSKFTKTNRSAVLTLAKEQMKTLKKGNVLILRQSEDIFRDTIARATDLSVSGSTTRQQAAQQALNEFADRGIRVFKDRSGRSWDIASYAEMSTRTALRNTMMESYSMKLQEAERDLVIVSDSPEECELCRPWEGKVLSLSGNSSKYPALSEAVSSGLYHPGCTHRHHLYIPGVTKPYRNTANPSGYKERKQQRYLERGVRKWKLREEVAITDDEKLYAKRKRKQWQAKLREFTEETGQRRRYHRESITRAR